MRNKNRVRKSQKKKLNKKVCIKIYDEYKKIFLLKDNRKQISKFKRRNLLQ